MTGRDLKAWRLKGGLKAHEAAELMGVPRAVYMRWEATTDELPRYIALAASAISLRVPPAAG